MDIHWLNKFNDKKIVLLGYGLEGKSTYNVLKKYCRGCEVQVMDLNTDYVKGCFAGAEDQPFIYDAADYLDIHKDVDMVFKSPGIPLMDLEGKIDLSLVTSQSNEFIEAYRDKIIGITGTKGKSTTASFLHFLLTRFDCQAEVVGNIGKPAFDYLDTETVTQYFVYELSSHQLETVQSSPKYAVLLNIFEEHLDHYHSYGHYAEAKMNIARWQRSEDFFVYSALTDEIPSREHGFEGCKLPISRQPSLKGICDMDNKIEINYASTCVLSDGDAPNLRGHHNLMNMSVSVLVAQLLGFSNQTVILKALNDFKGLPHRLAYVATIEGVSYYNDSISTIPQATIAAVNAIENVATVIVGGMNRGIDYSLLLDFIRSNTHILWLMLPNSGHLMSQTLGNLPHVVVVPTLEAAVATAMEKTRKGKACLLSPAAASYGFYKNFEERGRIFEALVLAGEK